MSDKKQETGWAPEAASNAPESWQAATVDPAAVERIQSYEQQFRDERAAKRAEREAREEEVTFTEEIDVTDPGRVHPAVERQGTGWEASQGLARAAEIEAEAVQREGASEAVQAAEVEAEQPTQAAPEDGLSPEAAAALERIRAAREQEREANEQGLER